MQHFNPRSPHGERRAEPSKSAKVLEISIHAPRTGSDEATLNAKQEWFLISIHAPRTGSDFQHLCGFARLCAFQSTLPARGATTELSRVQIAKLFQSTLPARGATRRADVPANSHPISIHAPRTGSDPVIDIFNIARHAFQSTLPARGATPSSGTPASP